jgi:hypothetical protein
MPDSNWWQEAMNNRQQAQPSIPQPEPESNTDDLIAQAKALTAQYKPTMSVQERFGQEPGADIGTPARKHHSETVAEASPLDLSPQQRAVAAQLGAQAGMFGPGSVHAREAHDQAAIVQELVRDKTFVTDGSGQPPQRF